MPCYFPLSILLGQYVLALWDSAVSREPTQPSEAGILVLWPRLMIAGGVALMLAGCFLPVRAIKCDSVARFLTDGGICDCASSPQTAATSRGLRDRDRSRPPGHQLLFGMWLLPSLKPFHLSRQIAETINQVYPKSGGVPVLLCGYEEPAMIFYLNKPVRSVSADKLPEGRCASSTALAWWPSQQLIGNLYRRNSHVNSNSGLRRVSPGSIMAG